MSIVSKLCGFAALALAAVATPAHAQDEADSWFYLGASAGRAEYSQDDGYYAPFRAFPFSDDVTVDLVAESGVDLRSSHHTERFHAGYRANRYLALEVGYADLGESEQVTFCESICPPEDHGRSTSSARRADLSAVAILPFGQRVEVFGKLGVARTQHKTYWPMGFLHTDVEYFTTVIHGIGARFFVAPEWALRLEIDRSEVPASGLNHHPATKRVDSIRLGVEYGFR